ncbi:Ribosomal large subunit pseudouridine synthase A [Rubripirellula tenax]|uniref:Ribosomal large subunit pseudouridine synthase A n=1 Tax=Rubripirellula tenax TaxID=2528015 RepID=A0A5C6EYB9_9BACT|nr:RluA family pseudouridine synthase [Rubripirellula tenax]TWU54633.1 Ribosomal large subunit pseudouridine synthase A [Rubripirellula tenax]
MQDISILWDGGHLIAVDKPPGLSTQAPPGGESLESQLKIQLADRSDYFAIVHRLDRHVGGVVLIALRKKEARLLSDQFSSRKVIKQYAAIVAGKIESGGSDEDIVWTDSIRKLPDQPKAEVCSAGDLDAKEAETRIEVVGYDAAKDQTLLRMYPYTGRMHQLRIQAAHRGHPIVGDDLYGGPTSESLMLRAESIVFHDPKNGKLKTVRGPALPSTDVFG